MRPYPLIVFLLAFAVRMLLFCLDDGIIPDKGDSPGYLALAESVKNGTGFTLDGRIPTASRGPLYPVFLAGVLSLPGAGTRTIQFFQIIIDSLTCLLLYFLAGKLLDKSHGLACGVLMALYIPLASLSLFVLTETLFTFFLVATILLLVLGRLRILFSAAAGLLMGAAALVRSNGVAIAFFLLLWLLYTHGCKKSLRHVFAFMFCMILVLSPWIIRNAIVFNRFIPASTLTGLTLYNSYIIPEKGFGYNEIKPEHRHVFELDNEADRSACLGRIAIQHILHNPIEALKLIPVKLSLIVYPFDLRWLLPYSLFRFNIFWFTVLILAGIAFISDTSFILNRLNIVVFLLGTLLLTTVVFYGSPRMRVPFDPFIIMLSAVGVMWIWRKERRWLWIAGIIGCNFILLFLGESTWFVRMVGNLKPW